MGVPLRVGSWLCALALGGCANYQAVTSFAGETTAMTGAVRQELRQVARLCSEAADVRLLLAEATPTGDVEAARALARSCLLTGDALLPFQEVTVDTLDLYARTLLALVDNKPSEVRSAIQGTARKLAALTDKDGNPLVSPPRLSAVGGVLGLLAQATTEAQREEGLRRLVAAGPDLVNNARILRSFFIADAGPADYDRWLATTGRIARGSEIGIGLGKPLAVAEPIRTAELRRQIAATQQLIEARAARADRPGEVAAKIVAAIDAWIAAVAVFQQEALKPDSHALRARLEAFRTKTVEAREAIEASVQPGGQP